MLTGDQLAIAKETAKRLGMGDNILVSERLGLTDGGSALGDYVEDADG